MDSFADPPLMQRLLLEQPWPAVLALLAVAIGLTLVGRRQNNRPLRMIAWVAAIMAGAVLALAWQVQTPREQLIERTRQLVAATQSPLDLADLDAWLAPAAPVTGPDGVLWMQREELDRRLRQIDQRRAINSHEIEAVDAETTRPDHGRTGVVLDTRLGQQGEYGPIRTTWHLHWRKDEDGAWRIHEIQCMRFNNRRATRDVLQPQRPPDEMSPYF